MPGVCRVFYSIFNLFPWFILLFLSWNCFLLVLINWTSSKHLGSLGSKTLQAKKLKNLLPTNGCCGHWQISAVCMLARCDLGSTMLCTRHIEFSNSEMILYDTICMICFHCLIMLYTCLHDCISTVLDFDIFARWETGLAHVALLHLIAKIAQAIQETRHPIWHSHCEAVQRAACW